MENLPVRNPRMLIIAGGVILVLLLLIFVVLSATKNQKTQSQNSQTPITGQQDPIDTNSDPNKATTNVNRQKPPQPGVFMKVGEELLYESDLNYELSYYPPSNTGEPEEILRNKMIEDSVILQAAAAEKLVELDETIYNSPDKDYAKRIQVVMDLRDQIDQKATELEGEVISIWFHNMKPGSAGYDKAKQTALQEMNTILVDLKANKITMKQAGDRIKNNQNLAQVDSSWRANAYFDFAVMDNQKITYSPEIDKEIYTLNKGQISPLLIGKDHDPKTNTKIDAVYMIAQITDRSTSQVISYDDWLADKKKAYEVTRY